MHVAPPVNPPCQLLEVGMMGTSDRSKLWIMSRESTMEPQSLQKLREHAKKFGHPAALQLN